MHKARKVERGPLGSSYTAAGAFNTKHGTFFQPLNLAMSTSPIKTNTGTAGSGSGSGSGSGTLRGTSRKKTCRGNCGSVECPICRTAMQLASAGDARPNNQDEVARDSAPDFTATAWAARSATGLRAKFQHDTPQTFMPRILGKIEKIDTQYTANVAQLTLAWGSDTVGTHVQDSSSISLPGAEKRAASRLLAPVIKEPSMKYANSLSFSKVDNSHEAAEILEQVRPSLPHPNTPITPSSQHSKHPRTPITPPHTPM